MSFPGHSRLSLSYKVTCENQLGMNYLDSSRLFIGKTPYNFMDNVGLYSVGKGMRESKLKKFKQWISQVICDLA